MNVAAVILAAGFGTRLAPLTNTTPKPLLDVGGRAVVSHLVDRLVEVDGLSQIVVVVNDQHPSQWQDWLSNWSGAIAITLLSNGVKTDAERRGAVADLAEAIAYLDASQTSPGDHIIVLAGDNLIDEPLQPHLNAAVASSRAVVLCRDLGSDVPPGRFGEVTTDDTGVITRFREKPTEPESPLAATCSYVLGGETSTDLASYLETGDPDSPGSFVAWLAAREPVLARSLTGRYFDIGNHETLQAARDAYR